MSKIISAQGPYEIHLAYRAFFESTAESELIKLKLDPSRGIAYQSAWEVLRQRQKNAQALQAAEDANCWAAEFVGFFEGKEGIAIPDWWRRQLMTARFVKDKMTLHRNNTSEMYAYNENYGIHISKSAVLKEFGDSGITIVVGSHSYTIDGGYYLLAKRETPIEAMVVTVLEHGHICVAFHGHGGGTYPVYCIEALTNKLVWESTVWSGVSVGGGTGIQDSDHRIEMIGNKDLLVVFGSRNESVYIEAFSTNDGKSVFRFSTTY